MIPVLIGVSMVTFVLPRCCPANSSVPCSRRLRPSDLAAARGAPAASTSRSSSRYWVYLKHLVRGDLGISFQTGAPVTTELSQGLGPTFEGACALILALVVGVALCISSALRSPPEWDHTVRIGSLQPGLPSPSSGCGLLLILLFYYALGSPSRTAGSPPDIHLTTVTHIDLVVAWPSPAMRPRSARCSAISRSRCSPSP